MAKKDIKNILKNGTLKQRVDLIADNAARGKFGRDKLLSSSELNQLYSSFKTNKEIKLLRDFEALESIVTNAVLNIQGLKYDVLRRYTNLRGYIFMWHSLEVSEQSINLILSEIKDPKERKKIAENVAKMENILFTENSVDDEGFIEMSVDFHSPVNEKGRALRLKDTDKQAKKLSLLYLLKQTKKECVKSISKWKGWHDSLNDYMKKEGFSVKAYNDILKEMEQDVFTNIVAWDKYNEQEFDDNFNPKLIKLFENHYNVCPNQDQIERDEEAYNWFKTEILKDGD